MNDKLVGDRRQLSGKVPLNAIVLVKQCAQQVSVRRTPCTNAGRVCTAFFPRPTEKHLQGAIDICSDEWKSLPHIVQDARICDAATFAESLLV